MAFDFFATGELPAPGLSLNEAGRVLRGLGVEGELTELGSQQDQNFLVTAGGRPTGVLKLANPAFPARDAEAQDAAAELVGATGLRVSRVLALDGRPLRAVVETSQGPLVARLLEFLPGGTFVDTGWISPAVAERMGRIAAQVGVALAGFDHPGLERRLQWDPRVALDVVRLLAPSIGAERDRVVAAAEEARAALDGLDLPVQAGHFDLTDDNLVRGAYGLPDGVIDFGDVSRSWRISELAITVTGLLHHTGPLVETVLAAVRGYHGVRPLTPDEVAALWPIVVLRGAVLVASGRQQAALDPANHYASSALDREWRVFAAATSLPLPVMDAIVAEELGLRRPTAVVTGRPVLDDAPRLVDLGVTAESADAGAWLAPGAAERWAASIGGVVAAGWGQARITESRTLSPEQPAVVATSATVWATDPVQVLAPWPGSVSTEADGVVLSPDDALSAGFVLRLHHARPLATGPVAAGAPIALVDGRVDVQLVRPGWSVPVLVPADEAPGWLALTGDPAPLLRIRPAVREPDDVLERRAAHVAGVQEHYYRRPPRIERGWRTTLVDTGGRAYLDMVNNVTSVGHSHPRIAAAASRQLRLLNTNSRFNYAALGDFAGALAGTLPPPLDVVFLVNSGSEATDLALRLAMAATGRRDVVALAEAYHGWTYASDAVSTSVADNPNALDTRPDWVHTVPAPNSYRGQWRDRDALRYGPEAAATIAALAASGRPPAGFIAEAIQGNAGGILLPDGYLAAVYGAVRDAGGLAIADEVQVGYGRLGDWFWGFESQGVVPDIVAVAKSIGNGYPLGAVITSREVADAYRAGGYFFSSTGGSPVSATVGLTVLDIIRDEALQDNARDVGARLKAGLEALAGRHRCIGTVHGHGLYLGLDLVSDATLRTPDPLLTRDLCERLRQLGVIMQPTGDHGNVLKIKPPLVVTADEVDFFVAMVDRALTELG